MVIILAILTIFTIIVIVQAIYTTYLMIYTWDDETKFQEQRPPNEFAAPKFSFTTLLPAKNEEGVISQTIQNFANLNYPKELVEALVICEKSDSGTIQEAEEKIKSLKDKGISNITLIIFADKPVNKPHALNLGLANAKGEVITIFDAEDQFHPDIFNVINTIMTNEGVRVVQAGVQLMDFGSHWYSVHNVLEYFFWFKSRLYYHAKQGFTTLGGNTIFFRKDVLEDIGGWDENILTEDADVGVRISLSGYKVRVIYGDEYATREETPPTLGQFIHQRTRWSQGFIQILKKENWEKLSTWPQRITAFYIFSFPIFQAILLSYLPFSAYMALLIKVPTALAILFNVPVYLLAAQFLFNVIGLYEFASIYGFSLHFPFVFQALVTYFPYQWLLAFSALRAVFREGSRQKGWEKTKHVGVSRQYAKFSAGNKNE
ncbi:MAG: glycosyltransferase [Patescibacteria group bacterium]|nr:glycosyltransferase [Patescibacteria group bacterium]